MPETVDPNKPNRVTVACHMNTTDSLGIGQSSDNPDEPTGLSSAGEFSRPPWSVNHCIRVDGSLLEDGANMCPGDDEQASSRGATDIHGTFSTGICTGTSRCFSTGCCSSSAIGSSSIFSVKAEG